MHQFFGTISDRDAVHQLRQLHMVLPATGDRTALQATVVDDLRALRTRLKGAAVYREPVATHLALMESLLELGPERLHLLLARMVQHRVFMLEELYDQPDQITQEDTVS